MKGELKHLPIKRLKFQFHVMVGTWERGNKKAPKYTIAGPFRFLSSRYFNPTEQKDLCLPLFSSLFLYFLSILLLQHESSSCG